MLKELADLKLYTYYVNGNNIGIQFETPPPQKKPEIVDKHVMFQLA